MRSFRFQIFYESCDYVCERRMGRSNDLRDDLNFQHEKIASEKRTKDFFIDMKIYKYQFHKFYKVHGKSVINKITTNILLTY